MREEPLQGRGTPQTTGSKPPSFSPTGCCKNISSSFSPWESQWSPRISPGFLPKPCENTIVAWFQHIIWHRLAKYRAQVHRLEREMFHCMSKGLDPVPAEVNGPSLIYHRTRPQSLEGFQPCSYKTQSLVARNASGSWKSWADKMQISHSVQTHVTAQHKRSNSILILFAFVSLLGLSIPTIFTTRFLMSCSWICWKGAVGHKFKAAKVTLKTGPGTEHSNISSVVFIWLFKGQF